MVKALLTPSDTYLLHVSLLHHNTHKNRNRRRRCFHLLPVSTMSNVRSLNNWMNWHFASNMRKIFHTGTSCFTETWFRPDCKVDIEGSAIIRAEDQTKSISGGLCVCTVHCSWYHSCPSICPVSLVSLQLTREKQPTRHRCFNSALSWSADQPVFILGGFIFISLAAHLPNLYHYVDYPTCSSRSLHLCYGNQPQCYPFTP